MYVPSLNSIFSKAVVSAYWGGSHVAFLCHCYGFNPFLCRLSPFLLSCVVMSGPCRLLEFYPNTTGPHLYTIAYKSSMTPTNLCISFITRKAITVLKINSILDCLLECTVHCYDDIAVLLVFRICNVPLMYVWILKLTHAWWKWDLETTKIFCSFLDPFFLQ